MRLPTVYILASAPYGTLYTGVTSQLIQRVWQHKEGLTQGFTKQYNVKTLVYFEVCVDMPSAIQREKRIKKLSREAKIKLIQKDNPLWNDLYPTLL